MIHHDPRRLDRRALPRLRSRALGRSWTIPRKRGEPSDFLGMRRVSTEAYRCVEDRRPLMQRLFSKFPNGWPGTGLLLLRIVSEPLMRT